MASQFGLTGPQLTVIKLLETFDNLSLSSLSERIRAQNSTVTGIIDRMEREGLVRRERSTTDRRVVHIRLSDKGQKLARQIQVEPMEIFRDALESLTQADLRDLLRIMNKLQRHVRAKVAAEQRRRRGPHELREESSCRERSRRSRVKRGRRRPRAIPTSRS